jgi:hypothetical protein
MYTCGIWRGRRDIVIAVVNWDGVIIKKFACGINYYDGISAIVEWVTRQMVFGHCAVIGEDLLDCFGQLPVCLQNLGLTVFLCPAYLAFDVARFLGHRRPSAAHMAATLARMSQCRMSRSHLHQLGDHPNL